jgi:hypothetical protein
MFWLVLRTAGVFLPICDITVRSVRVKASEARLQTFSTKIHCSRLNRYANCWGWIIKFMESMLQTLEAFGSITIEMSKV